MKRVSFTLILLLKPAAAKVLSLSSFRSKRISMFASWDTSMSVALVLAIVSKHDQNAVTLK